MKLSRHFLIVGVVAASVWFSAAPARAEGRVDKLERGLAGMALGGVEMPGTLCEECRRQGWPMGVTVGFFMAVGNLAAREVIGVFEFVTAPFPWPDEQYKPIMEPAYPWDRFNSAKEEPVVPPQPIIPEATKPAK